MKNSITAFFLNNWLISLSLAGFVFIFIMRVLYKPNDCDIQSEYIEMEINQIIDSTWNKDFAPIISLEDGRNLNLRLDWSKLRDQVGGGDLLIKSKGSLNYILIKPNGQELKGKMKFNCNE